MQVNLQDISMRKPGLKPSDDLTPYTICLPNVRAKELFHRTALDLLERLYRWLEIDPRRVVPHHRQQRRVQRLVDQLGLNLAHDPCAMLLYLVREQQCTGDMCVCDSAEPEALGLDRCGTGSFARRSAQLRDAHDRYPLPRSRLGDSVSPYLHGQR